MQKEILIRAVLVLVGLVILAVLSRVLRRILSRAVHSEKFFYAFLFPGTVFHETCHAVACLLTLTPIMEVHLFRIQQEQDGTVQLGEVVHGDMDPIRNMFIGVAPVVGAAVLLYFLSVWMLPELGVKAILTSGFTYLFLIVAFFIALGMSPSRQDMVELPVFIVTVAGLGVLIYYISRWMSGKKYDLSQFQKTVVSALRSANIGILIVIISVVIVILVTFVVSKFVLKRRLF